MTHDGSVFHDEAGMFKQAYVLQWVAGHRIAAGTTDHVTKPVDIEELLACIEGSLTPPAD